MYLADRFIDRYICIYLLHYLFLVNSKETGVLATALRVLRADRCGIRHHTAYWMFKIIARANHNVQTSLRPSTTAGVGVGSCLPLCGLNHPKLPLLFCRRPLLVWLPIPYHPIPSHPSLHPYLLVWLEKVSSTSWTHWLKNSRCSSND